MSVLALRATDPELYRDIYEEAQRLIRISDEVRISMERVDPPRDEAAAPDGGYDKLTTAKLATRLGCTTKDLLDRLTVAGALEVKPDHPGRHFITARGKQIGVELRPGAGGGYLLWPATLQLPA
jgi:hypothetical protein